MIDKVSKSLQSKDISTSTAAKMLVGLKVAIQSMRNAGIDEIYARATNNAQPKPLNSTLTHQHHQLCCLTWS